HTVRCRFKNIVDPIAESPSDVRNSCIPVHRHQDAYTINNDSLLSRIVLESRHPQGCDVPIQLLFKALKMFKRRIVRHDGYKYIRVLVQQSEACGQDPFLVFFPAATNNEHSLTVDDIRREEIQPARIGAALVYLIVPRITDSLHDRMIEMK